MFRQAYDYVINQIGAMNPLGPATQQERPFEPSPVDVLVLRVMIQKARALPLEIVNSILEFAEYWPCSHSSVDYRNPVTGHESRLFRHDSNTMVVCCP